MSLESEKTLQPLASTKFQVYVRVCVCVELLPLLKLTSLIVPEGGGRCQRQHVLSEFCFQFSLAIVNLLPEIFPRYIPHLAKMGTSVFYLGVGKSEEKVETQSNDIEFL